MKTQFPRPTGKLLLGKTPSKLRFLIYLLSVLVVITGICLILNRNSHSEQRISQTQTEIDRYAKLIEPLPPRPTPTATPIPRPLEIKQLPSATPERTYKQPNWSTPYPTSDYSSDYDSNSGYSGDKTVSVRGYYRKNGTYVRPHTRRAPRRR